MAEQDEPETTAEEGPAATGDATPDGPGDATPAVPGDGPGDATPAVPGDEAGHATPAVPGDASAGKAATVEATQGDAINGVAVAKPTLRQRVRRVWADATATRASRAATILALSFGTVVILGGLIAGVAAVAHRGDDVRFGAGPGWRGPAYGRNDNRSERPDRPDRPLDGDRPGRDPLTTLQHGQIVAGDGATYLVQRGTVTSVSGRSISVRSSDGFTATYALDDQTRRGPGGLPAVGEQVSVVARKDGARAISVSGMDGPRLGRRDRQAADAGA